MHRDKETRLSSFNIYILFFVQIVTNNHSLTLNLRDSCGHALLGTVTVHAEESNSSRMAVEMTLHALNLENKDVFSKSV